MGRTPIQLVPSLVKGLSPGPSLGVRQESRQWEFAVQCPCHLSTQRPPNFPTPGLTHDGCLRVCYRVLCLPDVRVSACVHAEFHVSEALCL